MDLAVGPVVKAYIEYNPDGDEAQLVELRLPFIPRVGEDIGFGSPGKRRYGRVRGVHWVFAAEDEDGIVRVQNVNIHVEPFDDEGTE